MNEVYERMESMGWRLDSFEKTAEKHIKVAETTLEAMEENGIEDLLTWYLQFTSDLMRVVNEMGKQ